MTTQSMLGLFPHDDDALLFLPAESPALPSTLCKTSLGRHTVATGDLGYAGSTDMGLGWIEKHEG